MRASHGAFSAVEVMVAVMVAATIGIPLLSLVFQERDTEQRSRFEYLALLAARDAAYQARALVACGQAPDSVKRDPPAALEKNPLLEVKALFPNNDPPALTEYSADQKRVTVQLLLDPAASATARTRVGTVTAAWVDPELAKQSQRRTSLSLVFGLVRPPGGP